MYPESSIGLNRETDGEIYFFTPAFHALDNFSAHRIEIWGKKFATAEHAFQWKKFSETLPGVADTILEANSPDAVKAISDANKHLTPPHWRDERVSVMEQVLTAKFDQHPDVKETLVRTGKKSIIENSPVDSFWGIGPNRDGQNTIGKIWMKIRDLNQ